MTDPVPFPEATEPAPSRTEALLRYLDHFRSVVLTKLDGLSPAELRSSHLPSGWTPLELLNHLRYMEMRWLEWGFEGAGVDSPWGDSGDDPDGRWVVPASETPESLSDALRAQGSRTRTIALGHRLDDVGAPGPRWDGAEPASLERVLLHVLQEYARHAGHLDVARELIDGRTGES